MTIKLNKFACVDIDLVVSFYIYFLPTVQNSCKNSTNARTYRSVELKFLSFFYIKLHGIYFPLPTALEYEVIKYLLLYILHAGLPFSVQTVLWLKYTNRHYIYVVIFIFFFFCILSYKQPWISFWELHIRMEYLDKNWYGTMYDL